MDKSRLTVELKSFQAGADSMFVKLAESAEKRQTGIFAAVALIFVGLFTLIIYLFFDTRISDAKNMRSVISVGSIAPQAVVLIVVSLGLVRQSVVLRRRLSEHRGKLTLAMEAIRSAADRIDSLAATEKSPHSDEAMLADRLGELTTQLNAMGAATRLTPGPDTVTFAGIGFVLVSLVASAVSFCSFGVAKNDLPLLLSGYVSCGSAAAVWVCFSNRPISTIFIEASVNRIAQFATVLSAKTNTSGDLPDELPAAGQ